MKDFTVKQEIKDFYLERVKSYAENKAENDIYLAYHDFYIQKCKQTIDLLNQNFETQEKSKQYLNLDNSLHLENDLTSSLSPEQVQELEILAEQARKRQEELDEAWKG